MKKHFYLFILLICSLQIIGQNLDIDKNYDCNLLNNRYLYIENPTKIDSILLKIECLVIRGQFDNGMNMLDSLLKQNPDNGNLYYLKGHYYSDKNIFDTVYISYQKKAIELNYELHLCLYNLGNYYYNYLISCESGTSPIKLSNNQKLELLNSAEINYTKALSYKEFKADALEAIYKTKEKRAFITNNKIPELTFTNQFDTLLIITQLRDCGEFGGHLEYIKCYHSNGNIVGIFSQDERFCDYKIKPNKPPYQLYKKGEQKASSEMLKLYVEHFKEIIPDPDIATNAPTAFWIIKDSNIYFQRDWTGNSKEYQKFRDTIFK
jgi:hypothetical protein